MQKLAKDEIDYLKELVKKEMVLVSDDMEGGADKELCNEELSYIESILKKLK